MKAIRNNEILIIQAGVGIGKSMGYLIPVFTTYKNNKEFKNIIISTSNIGLQQQLLSDIAMISNLLGIEMKAVVAKGINNYACINRINYLIKHDNPKKEKLEQILDEIKKKDTIDREELSELTDEIWNRIRIENRHHCSKCIYSYACLHKKLTEEIPKANIIITNHDYLAKSVKTDRDFIKEADMIIFDEAHRLEDSIRNIDSGMINLNDIIKTLNYYSNNVFTKEKNIEYINNTVTSIIRLFTTMRYIGTEYYNENNNDQGHTIKDCDKMPFDMARIDNKINQITRMLDIIIKGIINYNDRNRNYHNRNYKDNRLNYLITINKKLKDLSSKSNSDKIYWINFLDEEKIEIGYTSKNTKSVTDKIFKKGVPIIFTFGSLLDASGTYEYFKKGLSMDIISPKTLVDGSVYKSPYDFDSNTLFYYDKDIANPNDYKNYKEQLVSKITELIKITNGRDLILFTSKNTMEYVYSKIDKSQFDFKIMMQGEASNSQLCHEFEKNIKSCLFATGAFWEGVDFKGRSLCNVIITRLPFANVDAIMESKASEHKDTPVYLDDMVRKVIQGTGRLIRDGRDRGVICCLDSRFEKYKDIFNSVSPYSIYTTDIKDVEDFSNRMITNMDGKRGSYRPRKIKKKQ